ncbi:MAG TPA: GNAT family N-acetyltransferase [Symbiobacteriaceae bacterium]|jgi:aminoglycoside 6'-N-acetyltransferase|nr:GNAT family N-acetyltransferase [Symbiobacteriaceae bacterium]
MHPLHFTGLEDGPIHIRPLTDSDSDVATMARWLTDERVLEYYEGRDNPFDEARIRAVYLGSKDPWEYACLVEHEGRPIGYIQFYQIVGEELEAYGYNPNLTVYGMDQFIGEPNFWNRGIGTRMIRMVLNYLFDVAGARRVAMDPHTRNTRAIRAYEKCGFRKVQILKAHELAEGVWQDCWLMEVSPDTFLDQ